MVRTLLCAFAVLVAAQPATAEQVSFRYVPTNVDGSTSLYRASDGVTGARRAWWGGVSRPYSQQLQPTHIVTFRHPYNLQNVSVPLTLPEGTPRIEHLTDRIVYNYGDYTVTSRFLPDGTVEVIYDSGLFRPLRMR